jgi:hypothetical protein
LGKNKREIPFPATISDQPITRQSGIILEVIDSILSGWCSRSSQFVKSMQLEFVPVEEFYFALTLAVRTLEEISSAELVEQARSRLAEKFDQPSTVAASKQNTFNYVFQVQGYDNSPAPQLIVSIADWQDKLRLGSDYGWTLDAERKPVRTDRFEQRHEFVQALRSHLRDWLGIAL